MPSGGPHTEKSGCKLLKTWQYISFRKGAIQLPLSIPGLGVCDDLSFMDYPRLAIRSRVKPPVQGLTLALDLPTRD
jgi:hypothetical protein